MTTVYRVTGAAAHKATSLTEDLAVLDHHLGADKVHRVTNNARSNCTRGVPAVGDVSINNDGVDHNTGDTEQINAASNLDLDVIKVTKAATSKKTTDAGYTYMPAGPKIQQKVPAAKGMQNRDHESEEHAKIPVFRTTEWGECLEMGRMP